MSLDNLTQTAEEFIRFLLGCSSKADSTRCEVFQDEFCAVAFPPGVLSPFTEFTGPEERSVVVFSKSCEDERDSKTESFSVNRDSNGEASEVEAYVEPGIRNPFSTATFKTVHIGQPLSSKRVFLAKSEHLHSGQTAGLVTMTSAHSEGLVPLPLDKARYLCSLYALGSRKVNNSLPTIWITCESTAPQKVVALGCSFDNSALHNFTITEDDPIFQTPQFGLQGSATEKQANVKRRSIERASGWAFSEYEITGSTSDEKHSTSPNHSQLVLQFSWSDPEFFLSSPPESADGILRITTTPGYMYSPVLSVYDELTTLLNLCQIATGSAEWPSADPGVGAEPTRPLASLVETFLEDAASPLAQPLEVTVISPTANHTVYEPRSNLDFVEQLWMFTKEVESLEDLQQVFAAVFKAVLLRKVQPVLHRKSSSLLSTLFRQALLCTTPDDHQTLASRFQALLSDSKVLNCLVQIGIEKMLRDYRSFLVGADLVTSSQLDCFIDGGSLLEQCYSLCKLHSVLELNTTALSSLNLPTTALSSLTKVALEVYKEETFEGFSATPVFCLSVPAHSQALKSMSSLCSNLAPKTWILSVPDNPMSSNASLTVIRNQPLFGYLGGEHAETENAILNQVVYKGCCKSIFCNCRCLLVSN